jgi:GMP synthase (glutamine-hydrolysing)
MCLVCCEFGFWFVVSGFWFGVFRFAGLRIERRTGTQNQKLETRNRPMPRVYALQHVSAEPLGIIGEALEAGGIGAEYVRVFAGEAVPGDMTGAAGLVVMGGSMGVYERHEYPFLSDEIRLIEAALKAEKPVLGICLGSQLLASALGAEVKKGDRKEIGWFPVALTEAASTDRLFSEVERSFTAYHWHGDVFDLPGGAVSLASSAQTQCQAFGYQERAYGLLFHLEGTHKIVVVVRQTSVCGLEFGQSPSARRAMFIDEWRNQVRPPSGGPCQSVEARPCYRTWPS